MPGSIAYLTLQATREGQAAHAHVHEIIAGLRELGWTVELFEPEYDSPNPSAATRLAEFRRVQKRLVRRLGEFQALYVRAHPLAHTASTAARRAGVPTVQECNGPYQDLFTAWPSARIAKPLLIGWQREQYANAAALITVSDGLAEWLRQQSPRAAVTVIPNGANTELFTPDAPRREALPKHYVTFFGALARWQGVTTLLDAAADRVWPADVSVVIAGDGAEREVVERAAAASERIVYLGTLPYRDVPGMVAGSIAAISVQHEVPGRPTPSAVKVYEALSCGVPVIVSQPSGGGELVRAHSCGLVIAPDDPHALASAVSRLANDPERVTEMGARGRAAIVAEASWKARAAQTAAVLEGVLV